MNKTNILNPYIASITASALVVGAYIGGIETGYINVDKKKVSEFDKTLEFYKREGSLPELKTNENPLFKGLENLF